MRIKVFTILRAIGYLLSIYRPIKDFLEGSEAANKMAVKKAVNEKQMQMKRDFVDNVLNSFEEIEDEE